MYILELCIRVAEFVEKVNAKSQLRHIYSASMSWDLTCLTSSKVVVHNTCSTGTAIDRSEVYRYLYRYQYRY